MSVARRAVRRARRAVPARVRAGRACWCGWCGSPSTTSPACRRSSSACSASASSCTSSAARSIRRSFRERLPTPTFGTGGILWASLTLGLLTVPVVIVASEEALGAVPRSMREASLATGATKFQTIMRVVLPAAAPGILTGLILAMARGAGEVAPLMITGVVKLAPDLPLDGVAPFLHLERKFMHLGLSHLRRRLPEPERRGRQADGVRDDDLLLLIVVAAEPDGDRRAEPAAASATRRRRSRSVRHAHADRSHDRAMRSRRRQRRPAARQDRRARSRAPTGGGRARAGDRDSGRQPLLRREAGAVRHLDGHRRRGR